MAQVGELKTEKIFCEEKELHWIIPGFLSLPTSYNYESPKFKFLDDYWKLIFRADNYDNESVTLYLEKSQRKDIKVQCTFGIVQADGCLVQIKKVTFSFSTSLMISSFFNRKELQQQKSEMMPSNILTIVCKLKFQDYPKENAGPNTLLGVDVLLKNYKDLFSNNEFCDVTLRVKDKEFKAHKIVLIARSPVFAAMFKHDTYEKQSGVIEIIDCDSDSFEEFLKYLYCGEVQEISFRSALQLYKTADKYDVQELKLFCIEYMKRNLKLENVFDVIVLANGYDDTTLFAAAQDFFNKNLNKVFVTVEWENLFKNNFSLANKLLIGMSPKD